MFGSLKIVSFKVTCGCFTIKYTLFISVLLQACCLKLHGNKQEMHYNSMKENLELNKILKKCENWSVFGKNIRDYVVKNSLTLLQCDIHISIQNE